MNLDNNNYSHKQIAAYQAKLAATEKSKAPQSLNSSIINRIHNVRPGCGSCGK